MNAISLLTNENKFNLLAGRVPLLLSRFLSQKFKDAGLQLNREQWTVLAVLWEGDGCAQQVIANRTSRDKPSITRLVDGLVKEGYVHRKNDKTDRRTNLIFLTDKGKQVEGQAMQVIDATISEVTRGLSNEQIMILKDTFEIVYQNIKN